MPTGRATLDLSVAPAPKPPTVTHYTTTPKIRIAYNRNVFPTSYERNPAFSGTSEPDANGNYAWIRDGEVAAYCAALGFEPQMMVTRGPENESTAWWAGPGVFKPGFQRDSNRWDRDDRLGANNSDPLTDDAANAIGWLSQNAGAFMVENGTAPQALPLVQDIEGTQAYNDPDLNKSKLIDNWTDRHRKYRKAIGPDAELYDYMTPGFLWGVNDASPELVAADRAAMAMLSGLHLDGYRRPAHAAYPNKWRGDIDREIAVCKARYPELAGNVWVTISPFLDAGTVPMDLAQWKADIDWLVKRHGVHLFVWSSVGQRLAGVKDRLDYLAKFN